MARMRSISIGEVESPFNVKYSRVNEIMQYGDDNNYPTLIERVIGSSISAKSAAQMMSRFISGNGFVNPELNNLVVGYDDNYKEITGYKLLGQIATSLSKYYGYYVRTQFNGNLETIGLKTIPFKYCRFGQSDDLNYSGKIVIYDNWDGAKSTRGYFSKADKSRFLTVDVWNPNHVKEQMTKKELLKDYKGQVYFNFIEDEYIYPVSPIDPVIFDADTEAQIAKFKNGELRRGFFLKYVIQHAPFENSTDKAILEEKIKQMMGAGHEISHILIEGEFDDITGSLKDNSLIKIDKIEQNINDKIFEVFEKSCINNIRKAFNAIPQILIDYEDGKLGSTSGEALRQAAEFYNSQTERLRDEVQNSFVELFSNWVDPKYQGQSWEINKLSFNVVDDI